MSNSKLNKLLYKVNSNSFKINGSKRFIRLIGLNFLGSASSTFGMRDNTAKFNLHRTKLLKRV
jgi:hypothetical protein